MDDHPRVRKKREGIKVCKPIRLYTIYHITDKRERESEQKTIRKDIQSVEKTFLP